MGIVLQNIAGTTKMKVTSGGIKNDVESTPIFEKCIYYNFLANVLYFIHNHRLYPTPVVDIEDIAPQLHLAYKFIV